MALSDWTLRISGSPVVGVNDFDPIFGIGSLEMSGNGEHLATLTNNTYSSLGLIRGKMRSLFRLDTWNGSSTYDTGFFFMASDADLTGGVGSCYTCSVRSDSSTSDTRINISYHENGIESTPLSLFQGSTFTRTNGVTLIALEVRWVLELGVLNGIHFLVREGHNAFTTDFSNLAPIFQGIVFDNEFGFLTDSAAEGVYMDTRGSGDLSVNLDRTSIISLTPS
jgi:hypothetical protein